jgi:hypothetical protein
VVIHFGVAALLAVTLQLVALYFPFGSSDLPRRILFVASYLALFVFVAANVRRPGLVTLGLGLSLNFLAIVTNGGLMPTTTEAFAKTGDLPADARVGHWLPHSKDVLLERDNVHLYFLADRLAVEGQQIVRVFSVGDIFVAAGLLVTVADLMLPRIGRKRQQG